MKRAFLLLMVIFCGSITLINFGCAKKVQEGPPVPTGPKAPCHNLAINEEAIVYSVPREMPIWVYSIKQWVEQNRDKIDPVKYLYFVGTGLELEYEQKSKETAAEDCAKQISQFLFNAVDMTKLVSEELRNNDGFVPIQTFAHSTLGKYITSAVITGQYALEHYKENKCKNDMGQILYYWKYYSLFQYPRSGVEEAIEKTKQELAKQRMETREEKKKVLLESQEKVLEEMKKKVLQSEQF